jgi:hypothetical protein
MARTPKQQGGDQGGGTAVQEQPQQQAKRGPRAHRGQGNAASRAAIGNTGLMAGGLVAEYRLVGIRPIAGGTTSRGGRAATKRRGGAKRGAKRT